MKVNRLSSIRLLSAEAFWVGFGVFFSTIGTFVGVRMLTSMMNPEAYGQLALGVSLAMGMVYSIGAALWGTITRFYPVAKQDGRSNWYWKAIKTSLACSSVFFSLASLILFLSLIFCNFGVSQAFFWSSALFFGGVQIIGETGSALQNGARNRKIFSMHQNLLGWGRFFLAYLIVRFWIPGAEGAMLGFVFAALITMLSQRYWVKRRILEVWTVTGNGKNRSDDFFSYFKPLAFSGIFIWIQLFADRWALSSFSSLHDVGIYFALYQISFAPALYVSSFLIHFVGPILYSHAGDGMDMERLRKTMGLNQKIAVSILLITLMGVGVAFWIGNSICFLLIDSNYQTGFWAFPWLLVTGGLYSVGQQLLMSVYSGTDTRALIPFRIISTLLAVGCYALGGIFSGFSGIVWGGFIFSLFYVYLSFMLHRRASALQKKEGGPQLS